MTSLIQIFENLLNERRIYSKNHEIIPERYIYHTTYEKNIYSIMKNGLLPKNSSQYKKIGLYYKNKIFFVNHRIDDPKLIYGGKAFANPKFNPMYKADTPSKDFVVLKIDTKGLSNKFYSDPLHRDFIWTDTPISSNHISIYKKFNSYDLIQLTQDS